MLPRSLHKASASSLLRSKCRGSVLRRWRTQAEYLAVADFSIMSGYCWWKKPRAMSIFFFVAAGCSTRIPAGIFWNRECVISFPCSAVQEGFSALFPVFSFFCFFAIFLRKDLEERGWCVTLGAFTWDGDVSRGRKSPKGFCYLTLLIVGNWAMLVLASVFPCEKWWPPRRWKKSEKRFCRIRKKLYIDFPWSSRSSSLNLLLKWTPKSQLLCSFRLKVKSVGSNTVYETLTTESLILAQDERWRRA